MRLRHAIPALILALALSAPAAHLARAIPPDGPPKPGDGGPDATYCYRFCSTQCQQACAGYSKVVPNYGHCRHGYGYRPGYGRERYCLSRWQACVLQTCGTTVAGSLGIVAARYGATPSGLKDVFNPCYRRCQLQQNVAEPGPVQTRETGTGRPGQRGTGGNLLEDGGGLPTQGPAVMGTPLAPPPPPPPAGRLQ